AHARIRRIEAAKAKAAPGVLCVLTGADAAAEKLGAITPFLMPEMLGAPKGYRTFWPVLAADKVRFVGERVALVVAETPDQARDAADLVEIDYEPLPSASNVEDAIQPAAAKVWNDCAGGNIGYGLMFGDKAATDAAFARAKHVVSVRLENNRLSANAMEPRVARADYDPGSESYTLQTRRQSRDGVRNEVAHIFHLPETRLRVVAPDVGGGFGMKSEAYPEDALVLWASRLVRRPVKWTATRSESLMSDAHGRDQV